MFLKKNGYDSIPKCPVCNVNLKFYNGYRKTCSRVCNNQYRKQTGILDHQLKKYKNTMKEKYGVDNKTSACIMYNMTKIVEVYKQLSLKDLEFWLDNNARGKWKVALVDSVITSDSVPKSKFYTGKRKYTHVQIGSRRDSTPIRNHYIVVFYDDNDAMHFKLSLKNLEKNPLAILE